MRIDAIGSVSFTMSWICDAYELVRYILQLFALASILAGRNETAVEDIGEANELFLDANTSSSHIGADGGLDGGRMS